MFAHARAATNPFVLAVSRVCVGNIGSLDEDVTGGRRSLSPVNRLVEKYPQGTTFKPCLNKQYLRSYSLDVSTLSFPPSYSSCYILFCYYWYYYWYYFFIVGFSASGATLVRLRYLRIKIVPRSNKHFGSLNCGGLKRGLCLTLQPNITMRSQIDPQYRSMLSFYLNCLKTLID